MDDRRTSQVRELLKSARTYSVAGSPRQQKPNQTSSLAESGSGAAAKGRARLPAGPLRPLDPVNRENVAPLTLAATAATSTTTPRKPSWNPDAEGRRRVENQKKPKTPPRRADFDGGNRPVKSAPTPAPPPAPPQLRVLQQHQQQQREEQPARPSSASHPPAAATQEPLPPVVPKAFAADPPVSPPTSDNGEMILTIPRLAPEFDATLVVAANLPSGVSDIKAAAAAAAADVEGEQAADEGGEMATETCHETFALTAAVDADATTEDEPSSDGDVELPEEPVEIVRLPPSAATIEALKRDILREVAAVPVVLVQKRPAVEHPPPAAPPLSSPPLLPPPPAPPVENLWAESTMFFMPAPNEGDLSERIAARRRRMDAWRERGVEAGVLLTAEEGALHSSAMTAAAAVGTTLSSIDALDVLRKFMN